MIFGLSTRRPELCGTFGMVSCTNPVAAAAGMATLENGGNAFDAAVSAGLVLQIVDPERCGPGGEAVIIFKAAQDDGPRVLCGQGTAPADARPDRYKDLGLNVVPGTGLLAAPVPGAFDAWMKLLLDFGTKNLREVFQYAIGYAESGFPLTPWTSSKIRQMEQIFRQDWPSSAQVYLDQDSAPFALFTNKAIARTYQRILGEAMSSNASREGQINAARRAWYHGFIAEAVDKFVKQRHRDSSGMEHSGLITAEDFAAFESCYEDPICLEWRNWKIYKAGPWSTGPVFLQQLKLIDSFGDPTGVLNTPEFIHTFTEAAKLAYADRDAFYGDRHDVPLSILLSSEYTDARHRLIEPEASMELRPGSPGGKVPLMPRIVHQAMARHRAAYRPRLTHGDTAHLDVADRFGNVVSATPSGGFLTSSPVVDPLGFPLSTRLEMAWIDDGLPNTLRPGKRPRTTLSPTLAVHENGTVLAFASPGADPQEQWSLIFFLAVACGGRLQESIEHPMWDSRHFLGSLYPHDFRTGHLFAEESVGRNVMDELSARGHKVIVRDTMTLSTLNAVAVDPTAGLLRAAADPRRMLAYACGR